MRNPWRKLGRNALSIFTAVMTLIFASNQAGFAAVASLTWSSTTSGSYQYSSISTSDDGQKVIAVSFSANEKVMYSSNAGSTWANIVPSRSTGTASNFNSVAISGDGTAAYLVVYSGGPTTGSKVYKTTNFSTWTQLSVGNTNAYYTVSTNQDGTVVVIGNPSGVLVSTDGGSTWPSSSAFSAFGCDMSSSGAKILCFGDGTLRLSSDTGATWTSRLPSGTRYLEGDGAAISGNGSVIYTVYSDYGGGLEGKSKVYKSINDGVTWSEITANLPEAAITANTGGRNYGIVDTSENGSVVLIGSRGRSTLGGTGYQTGYLYLSDDSGASWTKQVNSTTTAWGGVTVNQNGSKMYAAPGQESLVSGAIRSAGLSIITPSTVNSINLAGSTEFATYRTPIQITVNVSTAGRVTFLADNKKIAGCINRATSGTSPNITATCSWSPTRRGPARLTATLKPTDPLVTNSSSSTLNIRVGNRTLNR